MKKDADLSDFIRNMCPPYGEFKPSKNWVINDDAAALGAVHAYLTLDYRPNCIKFISTFEKPLTMKGYKCLPILAGAADYIECRILDFFWLKSEGSDSVFDKKMVPVFLNSKSL